jgi:hypothetical protein
VWWVPFLILCEWVVVRHDMKLFGGHQKINSKTLTRRSWLLSSRAFLYRHIQSRYSNTGFQHFIFILSICNIFIVHLHNDRPLCLEWLYDLARKTVQGSCTLEIYH